LVNPLACSSSIVLANVSSPVADKVTVATSSEQSGFVTNRRWRSPPVSAALWFTAPSI
jgi:hypothetical protein